MVILLHACALCFATGRRIYAERLLNGYIAPRPIGRECRLSLDVYRGGGKWSAEHDDGKLPAVFGVAVNGLFAAARGDGQA